MSRSGDSIKEDKVDSSGNVVGCYLRYRAQFDEVSQQFYEISGCERFGLGFLFGLNNPLRTTYRPVDFSASARRQHDGTSCPDGESRACGH